MSATEFQDEATIFFTNNGPGTMGSFISTLPTTAIFSPPEVHYKFRLRTLTMDLSPLNVIDSECVVYYKREAEENFTSYSPSSNFYENVGALLSELNKKKPRAAAIKFTYTEKTNKVKINVPDGILVKISAILSEILGFESDEIFQKSTDAMRSADVMVMFKSIYLCSKCLAQPCLTPVGNLPLIFALNFDEKSEDTRRITFYGKPKRWIGLATRQIYHVDFYFLCADMKTQARFLPSLLGCEIELQFKRDTLY